MKLNEDKCHLMIFGAQRDAEITVKIGEACVKESREQGLLGIKLHQLFSFKTVHISRRSNFYILHGSKVIDNARKE